MTDETPNESSGERIAEKLAEQFPYPASMKQSKEIIAAISNAELAQSQAEIERLTEEVERLSSIAQKASGLLREVTQWHSDPESQDYNGCDKPEGRCCWCDQAHECIAALAQPEQEDADKEIARLAGEVERLKAEPTRDEIENEVDEAWLSALGGLGLKPVVYSAGETREETLGHLISLYARQIDELKTVAGEVERLKVDKAREEWLASRLTQPEGQANMNTDQQLDEWNQIALPHARNIVGYAAVPSLAGVFDEVVAAIRESQQQSLHEGKTAQQWAELAQVNYNLFVEHRPKIAQLERDRDQLRQQLRESHESIQSAANVCAQLVREKEELERKVESITTAAKPILDQESVGIESGTHIRIAPEWQQGLREAIMSPGPTQPKPDPFEQWWGNTPIPANDAKAAFRACWDAAQAAKENSG